MTALIIIIIVLLAAALIPIGASAGCIGGEFSAKLVIGPARITLFPRRNAKPKKEKKSRKGKNAAGDEKSGKKPKPKLKKSDIVEIAELALKTLGRLRRRLLIDELKLYISFASEDPFDAVKLYGAANAALGAALPLFHAAFRVKDEDIQTRVCFDADKTDASGKFTATFRVWEIIHIAVCAAIGYLKWTGRRKKRSSETDGQSRTA